MLSNLQELYDSYDGNWKQFFSDVQKFWREKEKASAPNFEQPHLLGCPWCGVVPEVRRMPLISPPTFDVSCGNGKCPRRFITAKSPQECADNWNTRVNGEDTTTKAEGR